MVALDPDSDGQMDRVQGTDLVEGAKRNTFSVMLHDRNLTWKGNYVFGAKRGTWCGCQSEETSLGFQLF